MPAIFLKNKETGVVFRIDEDYYKQSKFYKDKNIIKVDVDDYRTSKGKKSLKKTKK